MIKVFPTHEPSITPGGGIRSDPTNVIPTLRASDCLWPLALEVLSTPGHYAFHHGAALKQNRTGGERGGKRA